VQNVSGHTVQFSYQTANGNRLTKIAVVVVAMRASWPGGVSTIFTTGSYNNILNDIDTASAAGAFDSGYNQKCFFGLQRMPLPFSLTDHLQFNISNLPGSPSYNATNSGWDDFFAFCIY
jgi:hypothetical protein